MASNISQAVGATLFIPEQQWHFVADVTTLTYACCLMVHLMGNGNENTNIVLRYAAFAFAGLFKARDSWDSVFWEALLVTSFVLLTVYSNFKQPSAVFKQYDQASAQLGAGALMLALVFLGIDLATGGDQIGLLLALMHISGAASAYFCWKAVPCFDYKKTERVESFV
mmetsp:Transcript_9188/g.23421  ORF Transcript_9188/g.23421 Transcript_9188/m.23421 type:complete len:168 (+) Transcript_9188:330-833(+)